VHASHEALWLYTINSLKFIGQEGTGLVEIKYDPASRLPIKENGLGNMTGTKIQMQILNAF